MTLKQGQTEWNPQAKSGVLPVFLCGVLLNTAMTIHLLVFGLASSARAISVVLQGLSGLKNPECVLSGPLQNVFADPCLKPKRDMVRLIFWEDCRNCVML